MPLVDVPIRVGSIEQIAAIEDTRLRNLWITQAYHEFAVGMRAALGTDACWCGFAVWASATAGRTIRLDEVPPIVRDLLHRSKPHTDPPGVAGRILHKLVDAVLERIRAVGIAADTLQGVSDAIADGNTLVFRELAPAFARFIDGLGSGNVPGPADVLDDGAPDALTQAFDAYRLAAEAGGRRERAELVFHANLVAVLHEQQRLDANIKTAMDASILEAILDADWPWFAVPVRPFVRRHIAEIDEIWAIALTELVMTLKTGDETLHLGRDVPPPPNSPLFPPDLAPAPGPGALASFLQTWDPTSGTGRGSGADDWTRIADRMRYITNLFRSRQQHLAIFDAPFSAADLEDMQAGRLPPRFGD